MGEGQFSRIALLLADPRLKSLPSALRKEFDNVCGADILCGSDSILDKALAKATKSRGDSAGLGIGLLILSVDLFSDALESRRSGEEDAKGLFARSARTAEAASRAFSKSDNCDRLWGRARAMHCASLRSLGEMNSGPTARRIFLRCVEAGEEAVQALDENERDPEWIEARINLAEALRALAVQHEDNADSRSLLERAIQAHEGAVGKLERGGQRGQEAIQLNRFAITLLEYADVLEREDACEALERAAAVAEKAAKMLSGKDQRVEMALAQENLAMACINRAERESGGKARKLFSRAVDAFEATLRRRPREIDPAHWALTQTRLAHAISGMTSSSPKAVRERQVPRAIAAYDAALEVYTPEDFPEECYNFNEQLALAIAEISDGKKGKKARRLLSRAVQALETALSSNAAAADPLRTAHMKIGLAANLRMLSNLDPHGGDLQRHRRGLELCESAIPVIDRMDGPINRPMPRNVLGNICFEIANRGDNDEESLALYKKAVSAYQEGVDLSVGEAEIWKPELQKSLNYVANFLKQVTGS